MAPGSIGGIGNVRFCENVLDVAVAVAVAAAVKLLGDKTVSAFDIVVDNFFSI